MNQITDNKRYWKAIRPLLTDKCIKSSVITLINNENVIFDDFKLAQTFNNYFKNAVRKLRTKECEASSDMNAILDLRMVLMLLLKYTRTVRVLNENVSFESRFRVKEVRESDIQNEVSKTPRERGLPEIFLRKYLRILPIFVT